MTDQGQEGKPEDPPPVRIDRIERNECGQLVLYLNGRAEPEVDVRVARCFPWSLPDSYVSIRNKEGKEILLLNTLADLDEASRALVADELRDKVFNPKIRRVTQCKAEFGVTSIRCETDRGEVAFQIRGREDVRVLTPTRALLRDVDGNTYELTDLSALDPASRRHFQQYF